MLNFIPVVVAGAGLTLATTASSALATEITAGQYFEYQAIGTTNPPLLDTDLDFGFFFGGSVEAPGVTIDDSYALEGKHVYYGNLLTYTNIFYNGYHCCGFGRMEMLVTAPNGLTIEYWGHLNGPQSGQQQLLYSETVGTVYNAQFGWGTPLQFPLPPGSAGDITMIRWISSDSSFIAIDALVGVGDAYIPEPASWALLITGFGLVGVAARRRKALA